MAVSKLRMRLIIVIGAVILFSVLAYSTMQQTQNEYEVCVDFKGYVHCAKAKGATAQDAIHSAQAIDCEMLANGRDENMVCNSNPPAKVTQVK
jgi:hypothetical protein